MRLWLLLLLCVTPLAFAQSPQIFHLDNGLKLIIKPDHRAPLVAFQIWYKVGSSYEPFGLTGISHAVEHMMFKGTANHPDNAFSTLMANNGADHNAGTSEDYTYYYEEISADKLPQSLALEADRMRHLTLSPQAFAKEIQVIREERRLRIDDNPQALTVERLEASAYLASTYHHPIIGWMNDLLHLTIDDVKQWYNTWYAPNNAIIVIVGDVDPATAFKQVKDAFGAIPSSKIPMLKPEQEPPALGTRHVLVNAPAQLPWLLMAYNVPSLKTAPSPKEAYALTVLTEILDGSASTRNQRELVRGRGIATSTSVEYEFSDRLSTLLFLSATPAAGHSLQTLETALLAQIHQLQTSPVTAAELSRVQTQVIAHRIYAMDSLAYQANEIGSLESVGLSYTIADTYATQIRAVTAADIQAVARKYLTPDRLTIAYLHPK